VSAPVTAEALSLADALATAAHRLLGPIKEADHVPAVDVACHLLVERITADAELMLALSTIRALRYGCPP